MTGLSPDTAELWRHIREEAKQLSAAEPVLASFFHAAILNHDSFASALGYHIAARLGCDAVPAMLLREVAIDAYEAEPEIVAAAVADSCAHFERDPACDHYCIPLLYFKGFQAVQAWRLAHWLWGENRRPLALFLQNRISTTFDVDIHPAASLGRGLMVDHATGLVVGETAEVGDNVSMLHSVTLGGCGNAREKRHPTVGNGVLISTGAKLLGNIHVGDGAKIAAGSVVLEDVPAHTTVAGVPSRIVGRPRDDSPSLNMDQDLG